VESPAAEAEQPMQIERFGGWSYEPGAGSETRISPVTILIHNREIAARVLINGTCGRERTAGENFDAFTCLYDNECSSLAHENNP
jgi:hypothetical protein